jgi:ubiquinone/menaquinone biosynthesis C-methylase UbiE
MSQNFYSEVLSGAGILPDDAVLVLCGGSYDQQQLVAAGIKRAVISNVDFHAGVTDYAPYEWSHQDAENLTVGDLSFDWCIVHAGLHHCASPHRAMCEMLRVARKGIVVIEARDSALMRVAARFGMTNDYELQVAALSNGQAGGYRNTNLPNYIYRWTEREVDKTVRSYHPEKFPSIKYFYRYSLPTGSMSMTRSAVKRLIAKSAAPVLKIFEILLPKQGNSFGFVVRKDGALQPWLQQADGKMSVDMGYLNKIYAPEKYQK